MTTTYRCIGKGVTDSNGVAHMTHSTSDDGETWTDISSNPGYTGAGKGQIQLCASPDAPADISSGSVQSEPYIVYDTVWYDVASSSTHRSDYTNTGLTVDYVDDYTTLVNTASTEYRLQANVTNLGSITECVLEFDLYVPSSSTNNPQLYFKASTPYFGSQVFGRDTWHNVKFKFKNGSYTCFVDDVETTVTGTYTSGNTYFQFRLNNAKMNFRKLMIYTI